MILKIRKILFKKTHHFKTKKDGAVMIEFALVVPILLTLMMGVIELSQLLSVHRKIVNTGGIVADLITQVENATMSSDDADIFLDIGKNLIAPLPDNTFALRIVSLVPNQDNIDDATAMVRDTDSEEITKGTGLAGCDELNASEHTELPVSRNIIAVVSCYNYKPVIGYVIKALDIQMRKVHFLRPRNVSEMTLTN